MKTTSRLLPLIIVGTMTFSTFAYAADPEVEARFKKGVELYNEADFRSAAVEFRRAYEKGKNFKILYNIAQCEFQTTNYVAALEAFEKYLAEGGAQIPAARRTEVETEIPKIKARIATVTIKANVPGATIVVDDQTIGTAPLASTIPMNAGHHKIIARMDGWREGVKTVEVAGGESTTVDVALVELPKGGGSGDYDKGAGSSGKSWTPAIVAWSVAGVFALGGVGLGLGASAKSDELKDAKSSPNKTKSELDDLDSSTSRMALLADIAFGVSIVSAGIATYFTIDAAKSAPSGSQKASVRIAPTLGGLGCSGSF